MNFDNLHQILRSLYEQMMPLCGDMAGVAKGIAGLGALFYVAYRVWQSLARAEPIDVFPMLRPFAIGLCIMFFPTVVLGTINSIMSPVVQGTAKTIYSQVANGLSLMKVIVPVGIIQGIINIPLSLFFALKMNMSVVGVLMGTVLSFMISAIVVPLSVRNEINIHIKKSSEG